MTTLTLPLIKLRTLSLHPLALITLGALALRLLFIGAAPLWYDEGGSVWMASLPFDRMIAATAGDTHPPLYLALLWAVVHLFGTSEAAVRIPSALASAACVPVVFAIAGRLGMSQTVSLVAAALMALLPPQIGYAQEARMYALLCLEFGIALHSALARRWWLLGLALAAMYYTHNYGLLYSVPVAAAAVGAIWAAGPRTVKHISTEMLKLAWAVVGAVALWFPWMFVLINQMRDVASGYWIQPVTVGSVLYVLYMVTWSFSPNDALQVHQALLTLGTLALAGWRAMARAHTGARACLGLVVVSLAVPVCMSMAWKPILLFRAMLPISLLLCILLAWAFVEGVSNARRLLAALVVAPVVLMSLAQYFIYVPQQKGDTIILNHIEWRAGDLLYHINDGSMVASHAYTPPDWPQYELPATGWNNIGDMTPATRAALGIETAPLSELRWQRAWVIHGATPMTQQAEDAAMAALLAEYPHRLIYLSEDTVSRLVIYLLWNHGVAKG